MYILPLYSLAVSKWGLGVKTDFIKCLTLHFKKENKNKKLQVTKSAYTINHGSAVNIFYLFPDNYSFF